MDTNKNDRSLGFPSLLSKINQDKRDIKQALKDKRPLSDLAKEKGINGAKPL